MAEELKRKTELIGRSENASGTSGTSGTSGASSISMTSIGIGSGLIAVFGITAIVLFIAACTQTSAFIGDTATWRAIKPQISRIWWQTSIGALLLFIGMFIYAIQYGKHTALFTLMIACLSLGLSFAAISMSAISTSGGGTGPTPAP
jgi:vacuolar-type H+-ATPase subunit I/STV1